MTQDNIYERRRHIAQLPSISELDISELAKQWGCSSLAIKNDIAVIHASRYGCTVYGLRDPETGLVRYVGQCNGDPQTRYRKHLFLS